MSRSHIRVAHKSDRRIRWVLIAVTVGALLMPPLYWVAKVKGWFVSDAVSVTGRVLETRIVLDHIADSRYGGRIYHRLEAHVQYGLTGKGQPQDAWLTASEVTTTRELLLMKQADHPKSCFVYWIPHHPETAKCLLS